MPASDIACIYEVCITRIYQYVNQQWMQALVPVPLFLSIVSFSVYLLISGLSSQVGPARIQF